MKLKDNIQQVLGARKILLENRRDSETSTSRGSRADVDDVDLKISSFGLHEAWLQKNVWKTKKPELNKHSTNATDETFKLQRIMAVQLGSL